MESKKIEKKKKVESLVPLFSSQKSAFSIPTPNLWFTFFFFFFDFDYTVGLAYEYGKSV